MNQANEDTATAMEKLQRNALRLSSQSRKKERERRGTKSTTRSKIKCEKRKNNKNDNSRRQYCRRSFRARSCVCMCKYTCHCCGSTVPCYTRKLLIVDCSLLRRISFKCFSLGSFDLYVHSATICFFFVKLFCFANILFSVFIIEKKKQQIC